MRTILHHRQYYNQNLPAHAANIDLTDDDAMEQICASTNLTTEQIDLIIGCPPCQKFSSLQDTTPPQDGESKDTHVNAYISLISEASPAVVVFENVPGILRGNNEVYVERVKQRLADEGYGFKLNLFNTANFGVPQARKRTTGLGIKGTDKSQITLPDPIHAPPDQAGQTNKSPWKTVEDAIADLPGLGPGESAAEYDGHEARNHRQNTVEFIKKIPDNGGSRTDLDEEEQLECHKRLSGSTSPGNVYGRMSWDEPAPTLTTRCASPSCGRFVHPEQNRGITSREAARLMTFPDEYQLPNSTNDAESLIGNAVPSKFIETVVGKFLSEHAHLIQNCLLSKQSNNYPVY